MEETDEAQLKPRVGAGHGAQPGREGASSLGIRGPWGLLSSPTMVAEGPQSHQSLRGSISMRLTAK